MVRETVQAERATARGAGAERMVVPAAPASRAKAMAVAAPPGAVAQEQLMDRPLADSQLLALAPAQLLGPAMPQTSLRQRCPAGPCLSPAMTRPRRPKLLKTTWIGLWSVNAVGI